VPALIATRGIAKDTLRQLPAGKRPAPALACISLDRLIASLTCMFAVKAGHWTAVAVVALA